MAQTQSLPSSHGTNPEFGQRHHACIQLGENGLRSFCKLFPKVLILGDAIELTLEPRAQSATRALSQGHYVSLSLPLHDCPL